MKQLLVLGATGVMGQRLSTLAARSLSGVRVLGGWRHAHPATDPDTRTVDLHDPISLQAALADVQVVLNAVGPFEYDPAPLLHACFEAGCHYVDIAETPAFLARVATVAGQQVSGRPVHVLSGCSTVPGLVQVLAQVWAGRPEVRRIRVLLGMGSGNPASPTLLYSLFQPLRMPAPNGERMYRRLVRKRLHGLPARLYGRYPSSFDEQGMRVGERTLPATFHVGFDRQFLSYALWWAAWVVPRLSPALLWSLCRGLQPTLPWLRRLGTLVGVLSVEAFDEHDRLVGEVEVRALREGLNVPAWPAVWAARWCLEAGAQTPGGAHTLDQLFTPAQVADWLRQEGYQVSGVP